MKARTQKSIHELLAAYRGFALAAAAAQVVLITSLPSAQSVNYLVLGILALYSLIRVFLPYYRRFRDGYLGLGMDLVFCATPLFLTGGLASPFMLYSLCPILYAALVFSRFVALGTAALVSTCLVASLFYPQPSQLSFGFAGLYIIACFLVGIMPYTTNLSIYRRLEHDAALNERKRLARELHDTVAQALAYINIKATMVTETLAEGNLKRGLKELQQMKESLDSTYEEVRRTIETLGTPSLRRVDFVPALSHQVKEFGRKSGMESLLTVSGSEFKLSPQAADELLHIVGEAMVNARNHAHATTLEARVNRNGDQVEVTVKDDGCGFDLSAYHDTQRGQDHHGITIMKERAESLGGSLVINSTPGSGTEVRAIIPLE